MLIEIPKKKLDKVDEIALHHGFQFTEVRPVYTNKEPFLLPEEKNHIVNIYKNNFRSNKIPENPVFSYYDKPILINKKISSTPSKNYRNIGFDIIGVQNSVAEAIIINTARKILHEEGYENIFIDINCTGDKNSVNFFTNELLNYYKKNSNLLEAVCKKNLKKKDFSLISCNHEKCQHILRNAPKPINFLSERSQQHFKEVLEYMEEINIPYRINDNLISENNHYSKIIFEIKTESDNKELILARGGRYDEVARKIAKKRKVMAVGISMRYKKIKNNKAYSNQIRKPKILIIQFGFIAKLKSFEIIEILRQQKITAYQNLHKDKLTDQFDLAKKMKIPYIIIIGQKEAMGNEVVFKDTIRSTQDIVKINKLSQFLKKVKII